MEHAGQVYIWESPMFHGMRLHLMTFFKAYRIQFSPIVFLLTFLNLDFIIGTRRFQSPFKAQQWFGECKRTHANSCSNLFSRAC